MCLCWFPSYNIPDWCLKSSPKCVNQCVMLCDWLSPYLWYILALHPFFIHKLLILYDHDQDKVITEWFIMFTWIMSGMVVWFVYSKLPLGVNVCAWSSLMDWRPFRDELLPYPQCSFDRPWIYCDLDQDKAFTEDEQTIIVIRSIQLWKTYNLKALAECPTHTPPFPGVFYVAHPRP